MQSHSRFAKSFFGDSNLDIEENTVEINSCYSKLQRLIINTNIPNHSPLTFYRQEQLVSEEDEYAAKRNSFYDDYFKQLNNSLVQLNRSVMESREKNNMHSVKVGK